MSFATPNEGEVWQLSSYDVTQIRANEKEDEDRQQAWLL